MPKDSYKSSDAYKPSKWILLLSIVVSILLHFFVCKIPVESKIIEPTAIAPVKISFNINTLAAPMVMENQLKKEVKTSPQEEVSSVKKTEHDIIAYKQSSYVKEPEKAVKKQLKVAELQKTKQNTKDKQENKRDNEANHKDNKIQKLTANNKGRDNSTVQARILQPNEFVQTVAPKYPRRSVELGQQGRVLISAYIDANGQISSLKIHQSSGYQPLDKSAIAAVSKWRIKNINAITDSSLYQVIVPVNFVIE